MMLAISPFDMEVKYKGRRYTIAVTQVLLDEEKEIFEVSAGGKSKYIQTARPAYRNAFNPKYDYAVMPAQGTVVNDKDGFNAVWSQLMWHINRDYEGWIISDQRFLANRSLYCSMPDFKNYEKSS